MPRPQVGRQGTGKARLIPRTPRLMPGYGEEAERQHAKTYSGMAHFAATGPLGRVCKDCRFYGEAYRQIRNAAGEIMKTQRAKTACGKYTEMTGKVGGNIPEHAEACKYFEPKEGNIMPTFLDAALAYAARPIPVFPCLPRGKRARHAARIP